MFLKFSKIVILIHGHMHKIGSELMSNHIETTIMIFGVNTDDKEFYRFFSDINRCVHNEIKSGLI